MEPVRDDIASAYLFGSILDPSLVPRDVDLLLIARGGAGEPAWLRARRTRDQITPLFRHQFGIPLSGKVLTPSEWIELDEIFFKRRRALF